MPISAITVIENERVFETKRLRINNIKYLHEYKSDFFRNLITATNSNAWLKEDQEVLLGTILKNVLIQMRNIYQRGNKEYSCEMESLSLQKVIDISTWINSLKHGEGLC